MRYIYIRDLGILRRMAIPSIQGQGFRGFQIVVVARDRTFVVWNSSRPSKNENTKLSSFSFCFVALASPRKTTTAFCTENGDELLVRYIENEMQDSRGFCMRRLITGDRNGSLQIRNLVVFISKLFIEIYFIFNSKLMLWF